MPVFPLVGSMMVVLPGVIFPAASAASIIDRPMRSFTDAIGLKLSSFARTVALPAISFRTRTSGVRPMVSVISL